MFTLKPNAQYLIDKSSVKKLIYKPRNKKDCDGREI